ncbi:TIGR03364 family FAD-dependent oxidoreductase [Chitinophaga sp.]|uniref:TIGR03364 family FAD-dependent oxidoreductase n=1 Tax=Chitinophaga sp. TaxID=1869181 RepID=UPI0026261DA6|nr:TIGR03364 family FAD-dependent oxidoreductase [uncultured Chitinophaga sp.]
MYQQADTAVIGAGIVGLATAYHLALKGKKVVVFERNPRALGASFRNFGLFWTLGQKQGHIYDRALYGRSVWQHVAKSSGLALEENGSMLLAYHADEAGVMEEFAHSTGIRCELLTPDAARSRSSAFRPEGLKAALYSPLEMTVNPREASARLAAWLESAHGVTFRYNTPVNGIQLPHIETKDEKWKVDRVFVCSGYDFETLYPEIFAAAPLTRCKLQMLRTVPQPGGWKLGPALVTGMSMLHYASFAHCPGLAAVKQRVEATLPEYVKYGIHLMVTQNGAGELSLGDSHEYGWEVDPFDKEHISRLILQFISTFLHAPTMDIQERWHGIYPKLTNGEHDLVLHPLPGVTIVNGLGGAGMTLSFGLARDVTAVE